MSSGLVTSDSSRLISALSELFTSRLITRSWTEYTRALPADDTSSPRNFAVIPTEE